jgi:hypothetical protein
MATASKNPMSHTNLVVGGEGLSAWSRAAKGYEIYCKTITIRDYGVVALR